MLKKIVNKENDNQSNEQNFIILKKILEKNQKQNK